MAYIGNTVQNQGFAPAVDYFNGDGTTVTFTLSRPVASVAQLTAVIDNVIQNPSSAFTVSGNAITFTSAPLSGTNNIWVEYTSLVTTYAAISQDPSVIGDITASGGYLAVGDFGNTYIDGTIVDYVTGNARITTGPADGLTIYNGGTSARSALLTLNTNGALGVGTSPSYGSSGQYLQSTGSSTPPTWATVASSQWTTSGSNIYYNTGNVGIGGAPAIATYNGLQVQATYPTVKLTSTATGHTSTDGFEFRIDSTPRGEIWMRENAPIAFATNDTERMQITAGGDLKFNSGYGSVATAYGCRLWVNFNGTGTVAIRASGNVTSISDNGTGDYSVFFTNNMPDNNYAVALSGMRDTDNNGSLNTTVLRSSVYGNTVSTGSIRILAENDSGSRVDVLMYNVAVFR